MLHALAVWNESPSTNNGEFSSPHDLHARKNGPIDVGLGVPVAGDQKHVLPDMNTGFMNTAGRAGPGVVALQVDVTEV